MKTNILALGVFLLLGNTARAQAVSVGVIGGVPFTDSTSFAHDESRPYIVGASVEVRLPVGFAIEADGIYRPVGTTTNYQFLGAAGPAVTSLIDRTRGDSLEFPLLGKYYFRPRESGWQPFVGTGWALRTVAFHDRGTETITDANGTRGTFSFHDSYHSDLAVGAVVAAGVRFRTGLRFLAGDPLHAFGAARMERSARTKPGSCWASRSDRNSFLNDFAQLPAWG